MSLEYGILNSTVRALCKAYGYELDGGDGFLLIMDALAF